MKHKWLIALFALFLLPLPVFSLSEAEAFSLLGDASVYADGELLIWRVPMGLDGREMLFSVGDLPAAYSLEVEGRGKEGISLTWENESEISYYTVFSVEDGQQVYLGKVNEPHFIDTSAPGEGERVYYVASHLQDGMFFQSSAASEGARGIRLPAVEELSISIVGEKTLLEWRAQEGVDGYIVYRDEEEIDRTKSQSLRIDDSGEGEYMYKVRPYYMDDKQEIIGESAYVTVIPEVREASLITRVVNKKHPMDPIDYYPEDLVSVGTQGEYLREEAADAFNKMNEAATRDGCPLIAQSGFRSYDLQTILYDRYVANYGKEEADTFSARPGYSEHQTGLVMDIVGGGARIGSAGGFDQTEQFRWLQQYAHLYGWILRYPKGSEEVTGYSYESWHWRYIGVDEAIRFKESGLATLEEFYSIEGGDYPQ